jgi:hypothetical protein
MQPITTNRRPLLAATLMGLAALAGNPVTADDRRYFIVPTRRPCKASARDPQYRAKRRKANKAARKARAKNRSR